MFYKREFEPKCKPKQKQVAKSYAITLEVQTATQTKFHSQVRSLGYCDFSVTALKCSTACLHGAPCIIQFWLHSIQLPNIFSLQTEAIYFVLQ